MKPRKFGILGGTFDPVHVGHVILALDAAEALALERVLLVPAAVPPHKVGRAHAPAADRLEMVRRAVRGIPVLEVSDAEFARPGPSFSVDTVEALARSNPGAKPHFLIGEDNLDEIWTWKDPARLFRISRVVILARGKDVRPPIPDGLPGPIIPLGNRRIDLSSSEIRERIRTGRTIRYLVPPEVERYIMERSLYRKHPAPPADPHDGRREEGINAQDTRP